MNLQMLAMVVASGAACQMDWPSVSCGTAATKNDVPWSRVVGVRSMPVVPAGQGRNRRCDCGSGKKFKRCCAAVGAN